MAPKNKLQLSQEEFDEAVKTNMEDFGMEADEAVTSAMEEFGLQGYNLHGIIKTSSGGDTNSHPVALATRALSDLANNAASGAAGLQGLQQRVTALQQILKGSTTDELKQAVAVAAKEGSVAVLLAAAKAASNATISESPPLLLVCLRTLKPLMTCPACRAGLITEGGAELIQQLIRLNTRELQGLQAGGDGNQEKQAQQQQLAAAAAALTEATSWQDEEAKCRFVDIGVAADLLQLLQLLPNCLKSPNTAVAAAAVAAAGAAAGALRAFTTADDDRPPASKAFMHARLLAAEPHNALQVLLPALQHLQQGPDRRVGPLMAVLAAVRQIAANEEICKSFAESGGVASLLQLLSCATVDGPPELVRATAAALRQLANSDGIKQQLADAGVLDTIMRAIRVYSQPAVQEQLLGLLVALVLRMPAISTAAAEAGGVDVLTEVLAAAPAMAAQVKAAAAVVGNSTSAPTAVSKTAHNVDDGGEDIQDIASKVFGVGASNGNSNGSAAAVQRQACMAVRNMVVRNPELRPGFLAVGAEELLRSVKVLFPASCKDVASAALRDLGLDNYN